jgi:hypothetical protein
VIARSEAGADAGLDGVDLYGPYAEAAAAQQLVELAKRDGHLAVLRELIPPACNQRYPDDRFGVWCRCKRPPAHPGDHAYTYEGPRGQVTINWRST